MGRLYVIASITVREILRQPLLYIILLVTTLLLFVSPLFTFFCFDEEMKIRMIRDVGLAAITLVGLIIAIIASDMVITSEIERQTTLTTLSKPLSRAQFIIGKFLGIVMGVASVVIYLGLILIIMYWVYEGRPTLETNYIKGKYLNNPALIWQDVGAFGFLNAQVILLIKGIYASFLQVMVVTAAAVALATFFSLVITVLGCVTFFILGHLSVYIYSGLIKSDSLLLLIPGKIIYTLLPNLTNFNVASLVVTKSPLSLGYLGLLTLYGILYSGFILVITIIIFSRREIK